MLKKFFGTAIAATALALLGSGLPIAAHAIPLDQISQVYFFGDSLTDSGFNDLWPTEGNPGAGLPPLPAGKAPTFTTYHGYTWSQYVARDIKGFPLPVGYPTPNPPDTITNNAIEFVPGFVSGTLTGVDFAAGGSTTNSTGLTETWAPSLHQQITYFLGISPPTLDPNAVYFIWSGANDLLTVILNNPAAIELQLLTTANTAATNIASEVSRLAARGAKRVVVVNLPNLGATPFIVLQNNPALAASLKTITFTFNSMLNSSLGSVIAKTGIKVMYFDSYDLLDDTILATMAGNPVIAAGQTFKFVNYNQPVCGSISTPAIYCTQMSNNYIFADAIHPTDMAHRLVSLTMETQLQNWQ